MQAYHTTILALLALMGLIAIVNVFTFRSLRRRMVRGMRPLVSILLPARNEERSLGLTLATLCEQKYDRFEILVLDDNSDDQTVAVARRWSDRDARVRVLRGEKLPAGWGGKAFACHQLARAARGDLLLFVDADTVHTRQSIESAVAELQRSRADLLTVIPQQRMESFWEKVVLPMLHFSTFCYLPMPLVSITRNPNLAMANGQFMLFRRRAYEGIGGHEAVRAALVEDVWLARRVKKFGYRLAIRYGGTQVSCRMYSSLKGIWEGFSKNLFAGFGYSLPFFLGMMLFNIVTSIVPFVMAFDIILEGGGATTYSSSVSAEVGILLAIRFILAVRFDMALWATFLHPLAALIMAGISVNSLRWVLAGGGSRWKGRVYDFRNQPVS